MSKIIDDCYKKAVEVINGHIKKCGLTASAEIYEPWIYTRDVMMSSLGNLLIEDAMIREAVKKSILTLSGAQSETGMIPTCVILKKNGLEPHYVDSDSNLWYVLACYWYYKTTGDRTFLKGQIDAIQKSIFWLRCQDVDNCGLLETREASNWMDAFPQQHNVLSDNVLWFMALQAAEELMTECGRTARGYKEIYSSIKEKINLLFWLNEEESESRGQEERIKRLFRDVYRKLWTYRRNLNTIAGRPYYIPFASYLDGGDYFESMGNFLVILSGITDGETSLGENKADLILNYVRDVGINKPYPVKSIHPPLRKGDRWWKPYMNRGLAFRDKANIPYQYLNSAVWPFLAGFYIAALVRCNRFEDAETELLNFAKANKLGYTKEWGFNEFLHGQTGNPMGSDDQLWSASLYIYAYNVFKNKKVIFIIK